MLGSDDCTLGFKEIGLDCEHSKKTNAQSHRFHQFETVLRHFTKANHRTSSNQIIRAFKPYQWFTLVKASKFGSNPILLNQVSAPLTLYSEL